MVAVAVHGIAVFLFQLDESLHKNDGVTSWMPEEIPAAPDEPIPSHLQNQKPPDTLFFHTAYQRKEEYPEGVADMVGYWAENQILGGVVLFSRGESGFGVSMVLPSSSPQLLVLTVVFISSAMACTFTQTKAGLRSASTNC